MSTVFGWTWTARAAPLPRIYTLGQREYRDRPFVLVFTFPVVVATLFHLDSSTLPTWAPVHAVRQYPFGNPCAVVVGPIAMGTTSQFSDAANDPSHLVATAYTIE